VVTGTPPHSSSSSKDSRQGSKGPSMPQQQQQKQQQQRPQQQRKQEVKGDVPAQPRPVSGGVGRDGGRRWVSMLSGDLFLHSNIPLHPLSNPVNVLPTGFSDMSMQQQTALQGLSRPVVTLQHSEHLPCPLNDTAADILCRCSHTSPNGCCRHTKEACDPARKSQRGRACKTVIPSEPCRAPLLCVLLHICRYYPHRRSSWGDSMFGDSLAKSNKTYT
jgi:hypothetical protein